MNRKEELTRQFRALRGELNAITQAEDAAHNDQGNGRAASRPSR